MPGYSILSCLKYKHEQDGQWLEGEIDFLGWELNEQDRANDKLHKFLW